MDNNHIISSNKTMIVAEIGNNHEGDFACAQQLVREAAACGVDAVKFQVFRSEHYVSQKDTARFQRLKSFELSYAQFEQLAQLAHSLNVLFIATPFDLVSAEFLMHTADYIKVASGDNNFYPMLRKLTEADKPLIISTGVSDEVQVGQTVDFIRSCWLKQGKHGSLVLLHCVSAYPAPLSQVNLRSIPFLAQRFGLPVGYSDHTLGIEASLLAAALGAVMIEKHFTLDKNFSEFHDHQLSAEPAEMRRLVECVRELPKMLGEFNKKIQPCEEPMLPAIRRSIAAAKDLAVGQKISEEDLTWIRPAVGLAPGSEHLIVGKTLKRSIGFGELILEKDCE
jgi:sialic acid synthase SpsE